LRKDEQIAAICQELKNNGDIVDFTYDHFTEADAVGLPFAVYRRVAPQNFSADGVVYHRGDNVDFEIYAATPDEMIAIMAKAEAAMDAAELFYNIAADTAYIESEDFYETLYEI
jgi:hypothetical protein